MKVLLSLIKGLLRLIKGLSFKALLRSYSPWIAELPYPFRVNEITKNNVEYKVLAIYGLFTYLELCSWILCCHS